MAQQCHQSSQVPMTSKLRGDDALARSPHMCPGHERGHLTQSEESLEVDLLWRQSSPDAKRKVGETRAFGHVKLPFTCP